MARPPSAAPPTYTVFIACAPGLESLLLDELQGLRLPAQTVVGGAECQTNLAGIYRILFGVGLGLRVLLRVASFRAVRFAQLEKGFKDIAWSRYLPPNQAIQLRCTTRKSRLYHSKAVGERLMLVLASQLGCHSQVANDAEDEAPTAAPDDGKAHGPAHLQRLQVRMEQDICTVSLDLTGRPLHQRGYRLATGKAPLREDLARALLICAHYTGQGPLLDPFCGAGTFAIEAALLASGIPPGRGRRFALEHLPLAAPALAEQVLNELNPASTGAIGPLLGSDRDAGAITAAKANAQRAGLPEQAQPQFHCHPLSKARPPDSSAAGLIVANPPYGHRIGNRQRLRDLYSALGTLRRRAPAGYRLALVTSEPELARAVGVPLTSQLMTDSGGLKVRLYVETQD